MSVSGPLVLFTVRPYPVPSPSLPMSATKNWLHDYSEALDQAWSAMEEACIKINQLNDQVFDEDGEIRSRVPRSDAALLASKIRELQSEVACFAGAQEVMAQPLARCYAS